ncbi:hypothetical protein [Bhargavaea beijingensis]|uniref:Uncharacterized protein n=1 Tax=Bhargavaea beijingensis TaxID=426756 RepID=A0ABX9ZCX5_9BACL|nr:hypothetical protein [Bhargavaea beijingensis]RSK31956.1 hypothetical protein EJA12_08210 [Bhargavaea beijingensis]
MSDIREQVIDIRAQVIDILPKVIDIFPRAAASCRDFCGQRDSARAKQPVDKRVIPGFRCKSPIFLWRMGIFR